MIYALIISIIFLITGGFVIWNLLKKVETAEDIVVGYLEYLDRISKILSATDKIIKELDIKGGFEADDEVGVFFKQVKDLQLILNEFDIKNL
jgi:hypothetical protein